MSEFGSSCEESTADISFRGPRVEASTRVVRCCRLSTYQGPGLSGRKIATSNLNPQGCMAVPTPHQAEAQELRVVVNCGRLRS